MELTKKHQYEQNRMLKIELKTAENLKIIQEIPSDKIMIETDCPWCGIRPSHASAKFVRTQFPTVKKKRNGQRIY